MVAPDAPISRLGARHGRPPGHGEPGVPARAGAGRLRAPAPRAARPLGPVRGRPPARADPRRNHLRPGRARVPRSHDRRHRVPGARLAADLLRPLRDQGGVRAGHVRGCLAVHRRRGARGLRGRRRLGRGDGRGAGRADAGARGVPADGAHLLPGDPFGRPGGRRADDRHAAEVASKACAWRSPTARAPRRWRTWPSRWASAGCSRSSGPASWPVEPRALQRELPQIARALVAPLAGPEAAAAVAARIGQVPADRAVHAI